MKNRNIFALLLTLLILCSCGTQKICYVYSSFHEPANEGLRYLYSEDGLHWDSIPGIWLKPEIGKDKIMRDPSILRTPDGTYHLAWTIAWKGGLGFGYAYSKDLIHWSKERLIQVMEKEPTTVNVWAPELFYDSEKNQIIVAWASCVPGHFDFGQEDIRNNHRIYYMTTKDFKTISDTKLLYDPGFSSIDQQIVKRGPKDYVLVFKDNTRLERDIKVAFATSPTGPYGKASTSMTYLYTEGPACEKVGKDYLIYFDAYRKKIFGAVKTRDFKTFVDVTNQISIPKDHKHGTIFKVPMKVVKKLIKYSNNKIVR
ncbi:MAG: glycoside hydrolase family 43 protein [Bacteroidaceae bacterium]|nr:glycoside hydrolase family 43 protein [Bacteroidaceae bacterium]